MSGVGPSHSPDRPRRADNVLIADVRLSRITKAGNSWPGRSARLHRTSPAYRVAFLGPDPYRPIAGQSRVLVSAWAVTGPDSISRFLTEIGSGRDGQEDPAQYLCQLHASDDTTLSRVEGRGRIPGGPLCLPLAARDELKRSWTVGYARPTDGQSGDASHTSSRLDAPGWFL